MPRKTKYFHLRLDERDFARLAEGAASLGLTMSEYLRYLIRLAPAPGEDTGALVVDIHETNAMRRELTRWGHHYNQAVRALNAIDLKMRHGQLDTAECRQLLLSCQANLQKVDVGRSQISQEVAALQEKTIVG